MFKTYEQNRELAIAVAQQALGPLHHLSDTHMLADVGERRIEVNLLGAVTGRRSSTSPYQILELRVPLGVPARFGFHERSSYVHMGKVPIITTGDSGFDATWTVTGVPGEVVQRAFDQQTRARMHIVQAHAGPHLMLQIDASGALTFHHSVKLPHQNPSFPLTPPLVSAAADALCHFAHGLEATYRDRRSEIVAQQGEAAALAWEQDNKKLITAQPISWVRWALVGCLVLLVLGILAGAAAFVFAMQSLSG